MLSVYNKKIKDDEQTLDELMKIPDTKTNNFFLEYSGKQGNFAAGRPSDLKDSYPKEEMDSIDPENIKIGPVHSDVSTLDKKEKKQV